MALQCPRPRLHLPVRPSAECPYKVPMPSFFLLFPTQLPPRPILPTSLATAQTAGLPAPTHPLTATSQRRPGPRSRMGMSLSSSISRVLAFAVGVRGPSASDGSEIERVPRLEGGRESLARCPYAFRAMLSVHTHQVHACVEFEDRWLMGALGSEVCGHVCAHIGRPSVAHPLSRTYEFQRFPYFSNARRSRCPPSKPTQFLCPPIRRYGLSHGARKRCREHGLYYPGPVCGQERVRLCPGQRVRGVL